MEKLFKFLSIGLLNPLKIIFTIAIIKKKPNPTQPNLHQNHTHSCQLSSYIHIWYVLGSSLCLTSKLNPGLADRTLMKEEDNINNSSTRICLSAPADSGNINPKSATFPQLTYFPFCMPLAGANRAFQHLFYSVMLFINACFYRG